MTVGKKKLIGEVFLVATIFVFAYCFRMWFITLEPQPFAWDQDEYLKYALKIFYAPFMLASHSYRSYPWPFLEATIFKFVGWGNIHALYVANALLDSIVAVFMFFLLRSGFAKKSIAWIGYILYAVNPFTSGYVGTGLSEIFATFFIMGTLVIGQFFVRKPGVIIGLFFGVFAGMAAETRNAAFAWAGVPIALSFFWVNWKQKKWAYAAVIFGLSLTTLYPLYTNWRDFHEINITKVDSFYAMEFFNGASLKILPPFTYSYPIEQNQMWYEYWSEQWPGRTTAERKAIADKYWKKGWDIVRADPIDYIRWRFFKMWYVWQKENVFFYKETGFADHKIWTYTGNLILLMLGMVGMVSGWKLSKNSRGKWILLSFIGTIAYGTFAFSFSHAEYRLSIPFYPVIIALAALGLSRAIEAVTFLRKRFA
jgi:hypothetical protein